MTSEPGGGPAALPALPGGPALSRDPWRRGMGVDAAVAAILFRLGLLQHARALALEGFDDLAGLATAEERDLRAPPIGMPTGHARKLLRAVDRARVRVSYSPPPDTAASWPRAVALGPMPPCSPPGAAAVVAAARPPPRPTTADAVTQDAVDEGCFGWAELVLGGDTALTARDGYTLIPNVFRAWGGELRRQFVVVRLASGEAAPEFPIDALSLVCSRPGSSLSGSSSSSASSDDGSSSEVEPAVPPLALPEHEDDAHLRERWRRMRENQRQHDKAALVAEQLGLSPRDLPPGTGVTPAPPPPVDGDEEGPEPLVSCALCHEVLRPEPTASLEALVRHAGTPWHRRELTLRLTNDRARFGMSRAVVELFASEKRRLAAAGAAARRVRDIGHRRLGDQLHFGYRPKRPLAAEQERARREAAARMVQRAWRHRRVQQKLTVVAAEATARSGPVRAETIWLTKIMAMCRLCTGGAFDGRACAQHAPHVDAVRRRQGLEQRAANDERRRRRTRRRSSLKVLRRRSSATLEARRSSLGGSPSPSGLPSPALSGSPSPSGRPSPALPGSPQP